MVEKGQKLTLEITDINYMGKGVAKIDDLVVFIDDAIEGDTAEIKITDIKKNFAEGKLLKIIKKSEERINPPCESSQKCGGCQLMHLDYGTQLSYKKNRVINELKRARIALDDVNVHDTLGMDEPFRYRNKTAFAVSKKNNEIIIGPYEQGTYNTVDISGCMIQSKEADEAVRLFKNLMVKYSIEPYDKKTKKGFIRNIVIRNNLQNDLMFIIVTDTEYFPKKKEVVKELSEGMKNIKTIVQNINSKNNNLVMGYKNIVLCGDGTITDHIGDLEFAISPETFFQVNPVQTEKLYNTAIEYADLKEEEICCDIYCGIGTISLLAAKKAKKVYGIELVEKSIQNAIHNAKKNNVQNTEFFAGKAEEILPKLHKQKSIQADCIILDPPRKGCEKEVIDTMISIAPEKIVYVSCNPSTLARDIKLLEEGGYKLSKVQCVDMFPWTVHVECVALLSL